MHRKLQTDRPIDLDKNKEAVEKIILKETVRTACTLIQTWDLEKD